ncbi:MAG: cobalamin-independent methionine synthase II family protein [Streptosporangiaceae bacterium]
MNERDSATRAETVGSLLRPKEVLHVVERAVQGAAQGDRGEPVDPEQAREVLDGAVREAIGIQEDAGLDVITDGEMRRVSWAQAPRFLDCFETRAGGTTRLNWRGGSDARKLDMSGAYPAVVRRVSEAGRLGDMAAEYAFLARHAHARTKYSLAAPSYHRRFWSGEHSTVAYRSCEEFLTEVRDYEREVVDAVVALGCDYVQLDAPNYGSLCDPDTRAEMERHGRDVAAELAFDAELDNSLFDGIENVTRALHICRGNGPGGRWHSTGGYGAISGELFPRLDFDRLLLEYDSDRAGTFGPLADVRPGTVVVLGLLTTKSGQLETEEAVAERIAEAAETKPPPELALSTQCGFASVAAGNPVSPAEQRAKLGLVARLARRTWGGTGSPRTAVNPGEAAE